MTRIYPVEESSRVAEIRRAATGMARQEALDETLAANVALVVTEICTNLLKHAKGGEVFLSTLSDRGRSGIEILAVDRGPGLRDVEASLADGYSSVNTSGTGLGAIARLSQEFDIYSTYGKGTVLVARIRQPGALKTTVGAAVRPLGSEEVSGDAWAFWDGKTTMALLVADGLGHGLMAARASAEAVFAFHRAGDYSPSVVLQNVHTSLRGTRGAAVAIAHIDCPASSVKYAGIGNITGVLIGGSKPSMMISHNGTAGYHCPRFQEFSYPLPEQALVVMHSDGLHTNWTLDDYPGLRRRDPSIIAGVLCRDHTRNRDDVCVVVAKIGAAS